MDPLDDNEPPPPYSRGPPPHLERDIVFNQYHAPDSGQTFDCIEQHIADLKHCYEIRRHGNDKFTLERSSVVSPSMGATIQGQTVTTDEISLTTLYANDRRVATARFSGTRDDSVELYFGAAYSPLPMQWKPLRTTRHGLLHATSYEFEAGAKYLSWRHSHGPHLLGGAGDWILEDLSAVGSIAPAHRREGARWVQKVIVGGNTVAVFHASPSSWIHGRSSQHVVGQVKWQDEYGEEVELMALLALFVILQQS